MRGSLHTPSGGVRAGSQVLFLLTMSILSGALFALPEPLAKIIGSMSALALLWVVLPGRGQLSVRGRLWGAALGAGFGLACVALVLLLHTGATLVLAFALLLLAVHILRVKRGEPDPWLPAASLSLVPFAGFLFLVDMSAWADYVVGRYAAFVSALASGIAGRTVDLGPTYAGVSLTVFFILYAVALSRFAVSSRRKVVKTVAVCVVVVVVEVAYMVLWSRFFGARAVPANPLLGPSLTTTTCV